MERSGDGMIIDRQLVGVELGEFPISWLASRENMNRLLAMRAMCIHFVSGVLLLCSYCGRTSAQATTPLSLSDKPGVHIHAYDNGTHKSSAHYENLCKIVLKEFGLPLDSIRVNLVFVDEDLQNQLNGHNPLRFQATHWYGICLKPSLIIMLGEEESDDTFMHEYMHSLYNRGLLFRNVHPADLHPLIEMNEGLLLGSKSYLEYLKTNPR